MREGLSRFYCFHVPADHHVAETCDNLFAKLCACTWSLVGKANRVCFDPPLRRFLKPASSRIDPEAAWLEKLECLSSTCPSVGLTLKRQYIVVHQGYNKLLLVAW